MISAGRWTASSAAFRAALQVLQTVILARLLVPADFGLVAIVSAILGVFLLVSDLGISQALVHYDDIERDALSTLYWMNLLLGVALMVLTILVAIPISQIYHEPRLANLLCLGSLVFPLAAVGQQYRAVAQRDLKFGPLARNEIASGLCGFATAVLVAMSGGGPYALVGGMLVGVASGSVLALVFLSYGQHPHMVLDFRTAKPYLGFGGYLVLERIASSLHRQADIYVAGLFARPSAMGLYSVPRDLSMRFSLLVNPIVTRVAFPLMARSKGDSRALKATYLQILGATSWLNFPVYVAFGLFSNEIVAVLYGRHFAGSGIYLEVLSAWGLVRSVANPIGSLLYAVGAARRAMMWNLGLLIIVPAICYVAARELGLMGLAYSLIAMQLVLLLPAWRFLVRPACGATLTEFLRELWLPLAISVAAGMAAWIAAHPVTGNLPRLLVGGTTGAAAYALLSWVFNRHWLVSMLELTFLKPVAEDGSR